MQKNVDISLIAVIVFGLIAVVAQIVIAQNIAIAGVIPHFLTVYVFLISLRLDFTKAAVLGLLVGIVASLITTAPMGLPSFVLVLLALLASSVKTTVFSINLGMDILVLAVALLFAELLYSVMYALFGINNDFFQSLLLFTLPSALYDLVFGAIFLVILSFFRKKPSSNPYRSIDRKLR